MSEVQCTCQAETAALRAELAAFRALLPEVQALRKALEEERALRKKLEIEVAALRKALYGKKSEKLPGVKEALRKGRRPDPQETQKKRQDRAAASQEACVEEHENKLVPAEERICPACHKEAKSISFETSSTLLEYVPGYFRRRVVHRETVACSCGEYICTASPPPRILGQSKYGPGFVAHIITSKLLDSMPVYRMEKRFKRMGIPLARSTMNDLLHKAGDELEPIFKRMLELITKERVVQADETTLPVMAPKKTRRGYVWTFRSRLRLGGDGDDEDSGKEVSLIAYRYSKTRSSETPKALLGGTKGVLVVDGYTGYNAVTDVDGRTRSACLAHVRRKFFDASAEQPELMSEVLGLILDVYRVEHDAIERGIVRTKAHAELRDTAGRVAMDAFKVWLDKHKDAHPPKSTRVGNAIRYALDNWKHLVVFLDDVQVPVDNNASERALRPIAKGRDNWMFAGNDRAAERLTILLSLVATCEANGVNPEDYLSDVLTRTDTHLAKDIDNLLPHRWEPAA